MASCCFALFASLLATELHVPAPFATIQTAIDAALPGDSVVVAPGIYSGPGNRELDPHGKAITVRSTAGKTSCTLQLAPGFRAFEFGSSETSSTRIEGFTIRGGDVSLATGHDGGAAIIVAASPTFFDCAFLDNRATGRGGAVSIFGAASPQFERCTFEANSASNGGAIGGSLSSPPFDPIPARPRFVECAFRANQAQLGGAIDLLSGDRITFLGCEFRGNVASVDVSVMMLSNVNRAEFERCRIEANTSALGGSCMFMNGGLETTASNCLIAGNRALSTAGNFAGVWHEETLIGASFRNCTFASNTAVATTSFVVANFTPQVDLGNTILFGNGTANPFLNPGAVTVASSCIAGGFLGTGNISADPQFVAPAFGDWRLGFDSPCVDAGSIALAPIASQLDLQGLARVWDDPDVVNANGAPQAAAIDIGAHEANPLTSGPPDLSLAAGGTITLHLRGGASNAGRNYLLLGSLGGTAPAIPLPGGFTLPLAFDPVLVLLASQPNTPPWSATRATLDSNGRATPTFSLPPGLTIVPPDLELHHAAIVFGATVPIVVASTNAAPLRLVP